MKQLLTAADKALAKIIEIILIILISVMVGMIVWQVLCRYILGMSTPYAEELSRLAIVWCIFLGSALAVRYNEHMSVTALINVLPHPVQVVLRILCYLATIVLAAVMIKYGIHHLGVVWHDNQTTSLGYSRGWFYVPVPVTGCLFIVYTIANAYEYLRDEFNARAAERR